MTVMRRRAPPESAFLGDLAQSYYWDSHEAPLRRSDLTITQIYLALFAHHPRWARWLLILRGWIVAPFGLRTTTAAAFDAIEIKPAYSVGEKIARFTLYSQNATEIVTGGDDRHLDFRVSVRKLSVDGASRVVLSTIVEPHNLFGRVYLRVILPFHRLGVRALLANAARAGRI
ncbi:DUF2867 domain-containing protein [uncultured Reyranella sp.]|uniref:DUF2867 domain-containing protein n=1 Tax=uncultured Reyranella sp. TaxID=735512 RepID=UPI00259D1D80|nr:DUF2867 domain-containing protein [uncultured Reyranella sp.]